MTPIIQQSVTNFAAACGAVDNGFFQFPTWYQYLKPHMVQGVCAVDFQFPNSLPLIALAAVDILLRIAALIAIGFVVYGGIKYTVSQGEPQALANARETIIGALVGLAIATASTAIISFIGNKIGG
jgi:hypothetical protein